MELLDLLLPRVPNLPPHPDAQAEYDEIERRYPCATQLLVSVLAWEAMEAACASGNMSGLNHVKSCSNQRELFSCVETFGRTSAIAIAGSFFDRHRTKQYQILACDVSGSPWIFAPPSPQERAEQRLP